MHLGSCSTFGRRVTIIILGRPLPLKINARILRLIPLFAELQKVFNLPPCKISNLPQNNGSYVIQNWLLIASSC